MPEPPRRFCIYSLPPPLHVFDMLLPRKRQRSGCLLDVCCQVEVSVLCSAMLQNVCCEMASGLFFSMPPTPLSSVQYGWPRHQLCRYCGSVVSTTICCAIYRSKLVSSCRCAIHPSVARNCRCSEQLAAVLPSIVVISQVLCLQIRKSHLAKHVLTCCPIEVW